MHPDYLRQYYHQLDGRRMSMTTVRAWGGGSGFYLGISLRSPSIAFAQEDGDGRKLWPEGIDRKFLNPYYVRAENMLAVSQVHESDVSKNGQIFSKIMDDQGGSSDLLRLAVSDCKKCGFCITGCIHGSKHALYENYLPQSQALGARVICDTKAINIAPIKGRSAYRIHALQRIVKSTQRIEITADRVCLSAGTVGTAEILLLSRKSLNLQIPIARNVKANIFYKKIARLPDSLPEGEMYRGYGLPNVISYDYLKSDGMVLIPYKALPAQLMIRLRNGSDEQSWWGEEHVEHMKSFRRKAFVLTASGSMPGSARLSLRGDKLRLSYHMTSADRAVHHRREAILEDILIAASMTPGYAQEIDIQGRLRTDMHYTTTHQVGSCPLGRVTSTKGELTSNPGIFISDGSLIPASTIVPPSLTILALGEYIAEQML